MYSYKLRGEIIVDYSMFMYINSLEDFKAEETDIRLLNSKLQCFGTDGFDWEFDSNLDLGELINVFNRAEEYGSKNNIDCEIHRMIDTVNYKELYNKQNILGREY